MLHDEIPSWPCFPEDEVNAVSEVLRSGKVNYWTGEHGRLFEDEFAAYCGVSHGIALANGTVALELALRVLEIGPGDEVIVPPRTFIATVSSVVLNGATPVFAEVDHESQVITADSIRNCITSKTKAVILVHLAGWPCDMDPIMELADEFGLKVIEDCAQAHGARYKGKAIGSIGDVAVFSFCQDKIMSTGGEGGMLLTNDEALWDHAWAFKDHGKSHHAISLCKQNSEEIFCWAHETFGTNWRMTEAQSVIGRIQLKKLDEWVGQRRSNARVFEERLSKHKSLRIPIPGDDFFHSYYKFYAFIRPEYIKSGWGRDKLIREINAEGAPCFYGSCGEVYREIAFANAGLVPAERLSIAKELGETSLMFPVHPTLCEDDVHKIVDVVDKVLAEVAI
jgi:dTDP-4-amino-4,6-dideoxygalactose transaminase